MNTPHYRFAVALLFALSHAGAALAVEKDGEPAPDTGKFTYRDVFELEVVKDPQISPDGKRIVYVRGSMDIMKDQPRTNLWIVNTDGAEHRPLLSSRQSYSSPRWSPDGERLAYISGAEGTPQLYVRWMDTGQTALITNLTRPPDSLTWSPDGRWLAFTMFVPKEKEPLAKPPAKPEGADWAPPVKVIDTMIYRADGQGFLESGFTHIFVVPTEGGTPRQLTQGDFDHGGALSWMPDSGRIVFSANRAPGWEYDPVDSEIFSVAVDTGELQPLTSRNGPDYGAKVSPDGRAVAYVGFDDREQGYQVSHLYRMNADGSGAHEWPTGLDRDVDSIAWDSAGRGVYFLYDDLGVRKIGHVDLNGRMRVVAEGVGGVDLGRPYTSGGFTVARNGTLAFTVNTPQRPADVAITGGRGQARQLTRLNEDLLGHKILADVRRIAWKSSHDGREIEGWVVTPPDFDPQKKYPLILEIHGGPFAAYGPNYSTEIQLFAAAGYMVLYANPRGSTSYGEEFGNLIHHDYPGNDYDDLMSGVDAVIAEGNVDADNLFVTGGSGGGVLTAWIIGRTNRFRAAVVAKPVINWTSFVLTADVTNFFYKYWFPDFPWERQDQYWRRSPLSLAGNVSTPTMLLTGESDYRTPISESEQFYQALKLRKVETVMVRVPGASHELVGRPSNMIAKVANIIAWFDKHKKQESENFSHLESGKAERIPSHHDDSRNR
ncbi:MAG: S9 family peptidase [Gammaproteobacteria bacterium]|nr:S9 family peptidase [Gammaproteobacteria bacterium]